MKAELGTDGTLRVSNFETFLLVLVVGLLMLAIAMWFTPATPKQSAIWDGILALFSTAALAGVERSEFIFDRHTQTMSWRKRTPFGKKSGTIPLAAIKSVGVERGTGTGSRPSNALRLMIDTTGGSVPVTNAYSGLTEPAFRVGQQIAAFLSEGGAHPVQFDRRPR